MQKKRKAVGYFRYSSNGQNENSITYQRTATLTYCFNKDIDLVDEYVDEARSATSDRRPGFQRLMQDACNHPDWDLVLVFDYSRFARNNSDATRYTNLLDDLNIELRSITQEFDDSNEGFLMKGFTHLINEYSSRNNSKHTHAAMKVKASDALHCGGIPPLGYDVDTNKKLVINEEEAETVKRIYEMVDLGYSYRRMAEQLNEEGRKTKRGTPFNKYSFDNILKQEKYLGTYTWNKTRKRKSNYSRNSHKYKPLAEQTRVEEGCPAIIDRETFERVQDLLASRANGTSNSKARHHYMLGGLKVLKCAECGSYMIGMSRKSHGKVYTTYACPKHKTHECAVKEIRGKQLEDFVANSLANELKNRKDWKELSALLQQDEQSARLQRKLRGIEHEIANIMKAVSQCYVPELAQKLRVLSVDKARIEQQIVAAKKPLPTATASDIRDICKRFARHLIRSDDPDTKLYLKEVIREITVSNDEVKIEINLA